MTSTIDIVDIVDVSTIDIVECYITDLKTNGYAIVKNVLPKELIDKTVSSFWDWFEHFKTGVDRNDPSTWKSSNLPFTLHGIIQWYALGQEQFIWDIRSREEVVKIFSKIYGDDRLLVSFDGANFSKTSTRKTKPWPHIDQGEKKLGFHCVQGFVNLRPCGPEDGGLIVLKGSHLLHEKFWRDNPSKKSKGDWYKFPEDELKIYKDCPLVKVCCEPGDLVLWDSRTVHWASAPSSDPKEKASRYRMAIYVSYQPVKLISKANLKKKQKAFSEKRMTSHWAAENIKLFPKNPRTYGNDKVITSFPVNKELPTLNEIGKKLAGLEPY